MMVYIVIQRVGMYIDAVTLSLTSFSGKLPSSIFVSRSVDR